MRNFAMAAAAMAISAADPAVGGSFNTYNPPRPPGADDRDKDIAELKRKRKAEKRAKELNKG